MSNINVNIIQTVESKVREQFILGSNNRVEDYFNWEKVIASTLFFSYSNVQECLQHIEDARLPDAQKINTVHQLIKRKNIMAGECGMQAYFAIAEYLSIAAKTSLANQLLLIKFDDHAFIVIGDLENGWIHDPHGHEYYPISEFYGGAHHANRYGKSVASEHIAMTFKLNPSGGLYYQTNILITPKTPWQTTYAEGKKYYSAGNWQAARESFERSVTLQLNLLKTFNDRRMLATTISQLNQVYSMLNESENKMNFFARLAVKLELLFPACNAITLLKEPIIFTRTEEMRAREEIEALSLQSGKI